MTAAETMKKIAVSVQPLDAKTCAAIRGWLASEGGDVERTARFIARTLKVCGLSQARAFVRAAVEEAS